MKEITKIRIGTRGSKLALAQANIVRSLLLELYPKLEIEIIAIKTTGDKILEKNLYEIGGKGLFIKEIEEKLLDSSIDIAVHSMKDMPALLHEEFEMPCILKRENPSDALISNKASSISDLPEGAIIGTSSPRRAAQILKIRPNVKIVKFRGNIHTRMEKIKAGEVDATFLAVAGLNRSGTKSDMINEISHDIMLPAVAQGAISIEIRKDSDQIKKLLLPLNHKETEICVNVERDFLRRLDGSCSTPIAALAQINEGKKLTLNCLIAKTDGTQIFKTTKQAEVGSEKLKILGTKAAEELLQSAGRDFFNA